MAYETGTVTTASGLFTKIDAFMVTAGWTLLDTVNADDKVYHSTGSSGQEELYARLRNGVKDYLDTSLAGFQNQEHNSPQYEQLNMSIMQYWDTGSNTPTNQLDGRIGPWMFDFLGTGGTADDSLAPIWAMPTGYVDRAKTIGNWFLTGIDGRNTYLSGNSVIGPERRAYYGAVDNDETWVDQLSNVSSKYASGVTSESRFVIAYNANGAPARFRLNSEGADNPAFDYRLVGTGVDRSVVALANPPRGITLLNYNSIVWDGRDYIYATGGITYNTDFYRYTISTDTWIGSNESGPPIAVLPTNHDNNYPKSMLTYIRKESPVGVAGSWTSDRIYWVPPDTASGNIRYYNVDTDAWISQVALGRVMNDGGYTAWDQQDYIYIGNSGTASTLFQIYDISTNTISNHDGNIPSTNWGTDFHGQHNYVNQIPVDTSTSSYWLFGDKDHFICVTKDTDNKYYGMYVGDIDSYYPTQQVTLVSGISTSATPVNISVSGVFDQFDLGKQLYIVDLADGGAAEEFTLVSTSVNTLRADSIDHNYAAGAIVGVDPQRTIMLANYHDSVFAVHGPIGQGSKDAANNPYEQNYMQSLLPTNRNIIRSTNPGARGQVQTWPIIVTNFPSEHTDGTDINPITTFMDQGAALQAPDHTDGDPPEVRGQLHGMYVLNNGTAPDNPVSEDELLIGSDRYIVFQLYNLFDSESGPNMFVAIGPKT